MYKIVLACRVLTWLLIMQELDISIYVYRSPKNNCRDEFVLIYICLYAYACYWCFTINRAVKKNIHLHIYIIYIYVCNAVSHSKILCEFSISITQIIFRICRYFLYIFFFIFYYLFNYLIDLLSTSAIIKV